MGIGICIHASLMKSSAEARSTTSPAASARNCRTLLPPSFYLLLLQESDAPSAVVSIEIRPLRSYVYYLINHGDWGRVRKTFS